MTNENGDWKKSNWTPFSPVTERWPGGWGQSPLNIPKALIIPKIRPHKGGGHAAVRLPPITSLSKARIKICFKNKIEDDILLKKAGFS